MYKYLVKTQTEICIFFSKPYEGICMKKSKPGGWCSDINICHEGGDNFFVYSDKNNVIHLITITKENKLIYMLCKNNEWKKFEITTVNKEIDVKKIMISGSDIGENLFYSAKYQEEYILVHCILGNKAMPSTIDKLADGDFFVCKNRIYYQNSDNIIGYQDFTDGKPDRFTKICNGEMPYFTIWNDKEYLVYKKDGGIYVNENMVVNDAFAQYPVLVKNDGRLLLMWQSSDFVKYINIGEKFIQSSVRTVASGIKPSLYTISDSEKCNYFYGAFSNNKLKIFPDINPFTLHEDFFSEYICNEKDFEIQRLKKQLEKQKENTKKYRAEIKKLNEIIFNLKENQTDK